MVSIKTGAQCNTIESGETRKKGANLLTGYQQGEFLREGAKRVSVIYRTSSYDCPKKAHFSSKTAAEIAVQARGISRAEFSTKVAAALG
jgi:hypothetical protein